MVSLKALLLQAFSINKRSTVLQPLIWLITILLIGFIFLIEYSSPNWALLMVGGFLSLTLLTYLSAYVYHSWKNPDNLRSEKFTLSKMVIEKNLIGDNITGLIELDTNSDAILNSALPAKSEDDK